MTRRRLLAEPSEQAPSVGPADSARSPEGPRGASVVPIRRDGPVELATRCGVAAAPEFLDGPWPRWSWSWRLARRLMSVEGVDPSTDPLALRTPVMAFYETEGIGAALEEHYSTAHDFYAAFVADWTSVRFPEGQGPLEAAARRAHAAPVHVAQQLSRAFVRLISTAAHLQDYAGDKPIFLPTPLMAEVLGVTAQYAGQLLQLAVRYGYLEPVDPTWSRAERRARTYRYVGPKPD